MKTDALVDGARAVLAGNDMGPFFRPGRELYPHQWNWDSAFIALGLAHVDAERGRDEVRSLLKGQWSDGMVPHIVFHIPAPDYSPGPELWDSRACEGAPESPRAASLSRRSSRPPFACCTRCRLIGRSWKRSSPRSSDGTNGCTANAARPKV